MKTSICNIIQKEMGDFHRFSINDYENGRFALIIDSKNWMSKFTDQLRVETSAKRLIQLANDILKYFDKKAKWKAWKPTFEDLERRLNEEKPKCGIEIWFIDWVRFVKTIKDKDGIKQARQIYEWLKSNESWLYEG